METGYGEFVKRHRLASGFKSQRQLAEESGVSRTTISRMEKEEQKPTPETLKELAKYLKSTSYVELMVVCGYWEEEELLEPIDIVSQYLDLTQQNSEIIKETPSPYKTEKEFTNKLELSDEDLLKEFELQLDGKTLTKDEAKGVIAYLRSLRSIDQ